MRAYLTCMRGLLKSLKTQILNFFQKNSDDVKPVFSDKLFHYDQSSSDEGFEGSPAILRTPTKSTKLTSKWRSPSKSQHSTQPYLIEASPIRIQELEGQDCKI